MHIWNKKKDVYNLPCSALEGLKFTMMRLHISEIFTGEPSNLDNVIEKERSHDLLSHYPANHHDGRRSGVSGSR